MSDRTVRRLLSAFLSLLLFLSLPLPVFGAESYNDEWVADYENMKKHVTPIYTVPTLFKNDAAYGNNRRFPLVVQDNIEYVPLEMFMGLSEITVNAGYSTTNFYINNSKTHTYISFDTVNDLVTTKSLTPYTLVTKLFYQTRYVPAKEVADVLGITTEVYNDPENGVYALRFSDGKQKLSFAEVIKNYSPIKKTDTEQDPPKQPDETEKNPDNTEPQPPQTEDKPDIGRRTIYFSIDVTDYSSVGTILKTLEKENLSCAFFVSPDDILRHPDDIRKILVYGQPIGILLGQTDPVGDYAKGKENLSLVAKCTTHMVRFAGGSRYCTLSDAQYKEFINREGLRIWDYNISAADSAGMYDTVYGTLYSLSSSYGTELALIRLYPGRNTTSTLTRLAELIKQKRQLTAGVYSETSPGVYYRKIKE